MGNLKGKYAIVSCGQTAENLNSWIEVQKSYTASKYPDAQIVDIVYAGEDQAKATQMVSDAIAKSGSQALNYFIAQKYTEAVSQFATSPNAKTILFPVEATQLIGTLGGIGELAKEVLSKDGEPAQPRVTGPATRDKA